LYLEIITPDNVLYTGEVSAVQLPGSKGSFEVLQNHAAIISSLEKGRIRVKDASGTHFFDISGGIVEVLKNNIIVLT
jgi:F-type H+-transporting ATPase subunit epsilon